MLLHHLKAVKDITNGRYGTKNPQYLLHLIYTNN